MYVKFQKDKKRSTLLVRFASFKIVDKLFKFLKFFCGSASTPFSNPQKLLTTKGFTSAGLTGQASQLLFFNLAFVLGSTERYSTLEFVCNLLSLFNSSSKQDD